MGKSQATVRCKEPRNFLKNQLRSLVLSRNNGSYA